MTRLWILGFALMLAACGTSDRAAAESTTTPAAAPAPAAKPAPAAPPEPTLAQNIGAAGDFETEGDAASAGDRCDAYGAHMADLLDSDMFPATIGADGFSENCRDENISEARIACVLRADTLGDVSSCAGL
jgi:hypothetical protein